MSDNNLKNNMAAMFTREEPAAEVPAAPVKPEKEPEQPKAKPRRRSIIDRDPLPGKSPAQPKKKRVRAKKAPELRKSHSMTVLMTEQLFQRLKATAAAQELSMNGIITRLIRKYVMLHDIDNEDLYD